ALATHRLDHHLGHRRLLGTSRALISPASFQPSARSHVVGLRTISGSYVSRMGHIHAWSCSSFQSGKEIPLEKGSTSHVLGNPSRSSPCFRQFERQYEIAWRVRVGVVMTST